MLRASHARGAMAGHSTMSQGQITWLLLFSSVQERDRIATTGDRGTPHECRPASQARKRVRLRLVSPWVARSQAFLASDGAAPCCLAAHDDGRGDRAAACSREAQSERCCCRRVADERICRARALRSAPLRRKDQLAVPGSGAFSGSAGVLGVTVGIGRFI